MHKNTEVSAFKTKPALTNKINTVNLTSTFYPCLFGKFCALMVSVFPSPSSPPISIVSGGKASSINSRVLSKNSGAVSQLDSWRTNEFPTSSAINQNHPIPIFFLCFNLPIEILFEAHNVRSNRGVKTVSLTGRVKPDQNKVLEGCI